MSNKKEMLRIRYKAIELIENESTGTIEKDYDVWNYQTVRNLELDIERIIYDNFPIHYPGILLQVAGVKSLYQYRMQWHECTLKKYPGEKFYKIGHNSDTKEFILGKKSNYHKYLTYWQEISTIENEDRSTWELNKIKEFSGDKELILFEDNYWVVL